MIAGSDDEGAGSGRLAELRRGCRQLRQPGVVHPDIDDHPRLIEHQILERDTQMLAHGAGGTVAANDVSRSDNARIRLRRLQGHRHMIGRLLQADKLDAQLNLHAGIGGRVCP